MSIRSVERLTAFTATGSCALVRASVVAAQNCMIE